MRIKSILLAVFFLVNILSPPFLLASKEMITQEIRYHIPEAGQVFLVWGVDGWSPVNEAYFPEGTFLENEVMHTPMTPVGDIFKAEVQVPAGVTLNYGFQTRTTRDGIPIDWVWDGDYDRVVTEDGVIDAIAKVDLISTQEIHYHQPNAGEVFLVWGVNGWALIPEVLRPTGTTIKDDVMHTPMVRQDETFVAKIQAPGNATIDYGFLVTQTANGKAVEVWEANDLEDFHAKLPQNAVIEVQSKVDLPTEGVFGSTVNLVLPFFIGLSLILTVGTTYIVTRSTFVDKFPSFPQLRRLIYLRDLLKELVARDMKLRYKRSILGIVWSLINPLVQLLVLQFIFGLVLDLGIPNYAVFLFIGLLVWTWFQTSLLNGASVIVDNPDLIRRPGFPVAVLPVVTVLTHLIHFLLALPILFGFLIFSDIQLTAAMLTLPLLMLLQFLLTLSLSYFLAATHVSFRDTQYLLGLVLMLGFYLSPIFYDASAIPEGYQWLYHLNPMVGLIEAYRVILIHGALPNLLTTFTLFGISVVALMIGHIVFKRVSYRFVEEI